MEKLIGGVRSINLIMCHMDSVNVEILAENGKLLGLNHLAINSIYLISIS